MIVLGNCFVLLLSLLFFCSAPLVAQDFSTTKDGLKYKYLIKSDSGEVVGVGGYLEMHVVAKTYIDSLNIDSVLVNSYTSGYGVNKFLVGEPTYNGCINKGFGMLRAGDSVIFQVLADSLYQKTFKQPTPDFLTGKEQINVIAKVLISENKTSFKERQKREKEELEKKQLKLLIKEQKLLEEYANSLGYSDELDKLSSGLYFVKLKETDKRRAKIGEVASFFYKGTFIGGEEFESNFGGKPFDLTIGAGGAIEGWLEIVEEIKLGERWLIFLPSSLAYGESGIGLIMPNTPLIFEIELNAIRSAEEVAKEKAILNEKLAKKQSESIIAYVKNKKFTKADSIEVYYAIDSFGSGNFAELGNDLIIKIRGFDLDGNPIKELTIDKSPIESIFSLTSFPRAMEIVLKNMRAGDKARIVTVSEYFQGDQGGGIVEPFTPIYFEMDLISIVSPK